MKDRAMSRRPTVLVVDDDTAMQEMLVSMLEEQGLGPVAVGKADEALEKLRESDFDAVISDIRMPGKDGIAMVSELREIRPETPVILMTAFGSVDSAVAAMKAGAFDYFTNPFKRDQVLVALERAFERRELESENRRLRRAVDQTASFGDLIGASPAMREIFALIRKVANNRSNVLITGESGTGKEVVARTLHFTGNRAERAFIPVNCTAIPEGLLESELFGHLRGSFTGAHTSRRGLFEEACGGTLLLDEIGDMGPGLQSKLLRVLQDGEIRPVGGTRPVSVAVRIIAATNKDLSKEIEAGRFRQDLFYRLNVIPIHIPPLRERKEDIPALVEAFLKKHCGGAARSVSPEAMRLFKERRWSGNARELENTIERALALSERRELQPDDLALVESHGQPEEARAEPMIRQALEQELTLRQLEDRYLAAVLEQVGGNKVRAARILGINRRTLYRRSEGEGGVRPAEEDPRDA